MLDASMYELCNGSNPGIVDGRRHHLSLDLANSQRKCFNAAASHLDSSKVTSPDLEAFLLYASGGGSEMDWGDSTPTQILFPKSVTAEQEAYARGFVDALEELHRRQGAPATFSSAQPPTWTQSTSCTGDSPGGNLTSTVSYQLTSSAARRPLSSVSSPGSSVGVPCDVGASRVVQSSRSRVTDDGFQTVPRLSCLTPPSSPDVAVTDAAELARIDRKRERNRLAAQKCRSRKLEQIAVLESRCAVLRSENDALSRTAGHLSDDVKRLRKALADHTASSFCVIDTKGVNFNKTLERKH